jgi:hypothetical protein
MNRRDAVKTMISAMLGGPVLASAPVLPDPDPWTRSEYGFEYNIDFYGQLRVDPSVGARQIARMTMEDT